MLHSWKVSGSLHQPIPNPWTLRRKREKKKKEKKNDRNEARNDGPLLPPLLASGRRPAPSKVLRGCRRSFPDALERFFGETITARFGLYHKTSSCYVHA